MAATDELPGSVAMAVHNGGLIGAIIRVSPQPAPRTPAVRETAPYRAIGSTVYITGGDQVDLVRLILWRRGGWPRRRAFAAALHAASLAHSVAQSRIVHICGEG